MSLLEYLDRHGFKYSQFEGFSQQIPNQIYDLTLIIDNADIKTAMEIGFNAGHSAEIFLRTNPSLHLTSFDLGVHDYVATAKNYIDEIYPLRHTLILGDSTKTIPAHTPTTYDLIFIDGGHEYEIAKADLLNCRRFAHANTIVIMDDTMHREGYSHLVNIGPTKAWLEAIQQGIIVEIDHSDYLPGRGMSWGLYSFE